MNKIRGFARDDGTVIVYAQRVDPFNHHFVRLAHRVCLCATWETAIRLHQLKQRKNMHRDVGKVLSRLVHIDAFGV
ncbi:MAG: hypothetical protein WCJ93_04085 [Methanomicrobiales archaeon]